MWESSRVLPMQSTIENHAPVNGVERLEFALRRVLGESFESHLRAMVETSSWYRHELPCSEAFRLWICDNLEGTDDPQWVFQPLRAAERRYLCDELGIKREDIVGRNPREVAGLVMVASGLPSQDIAGLDALRNSWGETYRLVRNDEDERAAVLCRQRGERLLRDMLLFYCGLGYGEYFVQLLQDPGSLRLPAKLSRGIPGTTVQEKSDQLVAILMDDNLADLGFFSLALRRFSMRVEEAGVRHVCGDTLRILSEKEVEAFLGLGTALQSYHHDKPSKLSSRQGELLAAIERIQASIEAMVDRRVVPDELFVTEASCSTPFGRAFRGLTDIGKFRCLTAESSPRLGQRIRFVASADRDYTRCWWRISPWGDNRR
jgi:hypothetical protein